MATPGIGPFTDDAEVYETPYADESPAADASQDRSYQADWLSRPPAEVDWSGSAPAGPAPLETVRREARARIPLLRKRRFQLPTTPVEPKAKPQTQPLRIPDQFKKYVVDPAVSKEPSPQAAPPKPEGLYRMLPDKQKGYTDTSAEISVPFSQVAGRQKSGYHLHPDEQQRYDKDFKYQGVGPTLGERAQAYIEQKLQPVPHEHKVISMGNPLLDAMTGTMTNQDRAFFRVLYGLPGFAVSLGRAVLRSGPFTDPNRNPDPYEVLELSDLGEFGHQLYDQFKQDWAVDPNMAIDNLSGTLGGMFAIEKAGEVGKGKLMGALGGALGDLRESRIAPEPRRQTGFAETQAGGPPPPGAPPAAEPRADIETGATATQPAASAAEPKPVPPPDTPSSKAAQARTDHENANLASGRISKHEGSGEAVIAVNDDAMSLLDKIVENERPSNGVTIQSSDLPLVTKLLNEYVANNPEQRAGLKTLIEHMGNAKTAKGNVVFHLDSLEGEQLERVLLEELHHDWQFHHFGGDIKTLARNADSINEKMLAGDSKAAWGKALAVARKKYGLVTSIYEVPAHLISGDNLGLTVHEQVQLLADYHEAVEGLVNKGKLETSPMAKSVKGGFDAEIGRRNISRTKAGVAAGDGAGDRTLQSDAEKLHERTGQGVLETAAGEGETKEPEPTEAVTPAGEKKEGEEERPAPTPWHRVGVPPEEAGGAAKDRFQFKSHPNITVTLEETDEGDRYVIREGGNKIGVPTTLLDNAEAQIRQHLASTEPATVLQSQQEYEEERSPWFLKSERVMDDLTAKKTGPMNGSQMLAMLKNPKYGLSPDELKWTGLDKYLSTAGRVTPDMVKQHLRDHALRVMELTKGDPNAVAWTETDQRHKEYLERRMQQHPLTEKQRADLKGLRRKEQNFARGETETKHQRYVTPGGENYREHVIMLPEQRLPLPRWHIVYADDPTMPISAGFDTDPEAQHELDTNPAYKGRNDLVVLPIADENAGVIAPSKVFKHDIHFPENNIVAFDRTTERSVPLYTPEDIARIEAKLGPTFGRKSMFGLKGLLEEAVRKEYLTPKEAAQYADAKGYPYDYPEIVGVKDRITGIIRRILHLEEGQSDWHEQGRKRGYDNDLSSIPLQAKHQGNQWEITTDKGRVEVVKFPDNNWRPKDAIDTKEKAIAFARQWIDQHPDQVAHIPVPDAPFKNTWHKMLLRSVLHRAAREGFEGISWTGGEEHAGRWQQILHVGKVVYDPAINRLVVTNPEGIDILAERVAPEDLPGKIGPELAGQLAPLIEKWWEQGADINQALPEISGLNVKVGGEGMKRWYNEIIPNYLNDFGKKFGAKVSTITMPLGREPSLRYVGPEATNAAVWNVAVDPTQSEAVRQSAHSIGWRMRLGTPFTDAINSVFEENPANFEETAKAFGGKPELLPPEVRTFQYFEITPELRKELLHNGISLFQSIREEPGEEIEPPEQADRRPEEEPVRAFVSPNVRDLSTAGAEQALTSAPQRLMQGESQWLLDQLGAKAKVRSAVGQWEGGAENSLVTEFEPGTSPDVVSYYSATMAEAGRQKFLFNFFPDKERGGDVLFRFNVPSSSREQINSVLSKHGIKESTILDAPDGHSVLIGIKPEQPSHKANAAAQELGGVDAGHIHGRSEFVGDDDRDRAGQVFSGVIAERETIHPEWRQTRAALESRPDFRELRRAVREAESPPVTPGPPPEGPSVLQSQREPERKPPPEPEKREPGPLPEIKSEVARRGGQNAGVLSTRIPSGVTSTEDPLKTTLVSDLDALRNAKAARPADQRPWVRAANVIKKYDTFSRLKNAAPDEAINAAVDQMKNNLVWLYRKYQQEMGGRVLDRARQWYDGTNRIANSWTKTYKKSLPQIAGMMAVMSPGREWFQNASLTERVLDILTDHQDTKWDKKMSDYTITPKGRKFVSKYKDILASVQGKKLSQLPDAKHRAFWLRVYDEAHNPKHYAVITPEGGFGDFSRVKSGRPEDVAWGSLDQIEKAILIFENGSRRNISEQLGGAHKVRNFYNNIVAPNSDVSFVTIDTHAVAAAQLKPLAQHALEVIHNFGHGLSSKPAGVFGTYSIYAEAYRQAATELGIKPRELQSITWEAAQGLFPPEFKRRANQELISSIWRDYNEGKLTLKQAQEKVYDTRKRFIPPDWSNRSPTDPVWDSSYKGELDRTGVSGRPAQGVVAGTGRRTAGAPAERRLGGEVAEGPLSLPEARAQVAARKPTVLQSVVHEERNPDYAHGDERKKQYDKEFEEKEALKNSEYEREMQLRRTVGSIHDKRGRLFAKYTKALASGTEAEKIKAGNAYERAVRQAVKLEKQLVYFRDVYGAKLREFRDKWPRGRPDTGSKYEGRVTVDRQGRTAIWLSRSLADLYQRITEPQKYMEMVRMEGRPHYVFHARNKGRPDIREDLSKVDHFLHGGAKYRSPEDQRRAKQLGNLLFEAMGRAGAEGVTMTAMEGEESSPRERMAQWKWLKPTKLAHAREAIHGWQRAIIGENISDKDLITKHLPAKYVDKLAKAVPEGLVKYFTKYYPEYGPYYDIPDAKPRMVIEAAKRLMADDPVRYGISDNEAAEWLRDYLKAMKQAHGMDALRNWRPPHLSALAKGIYEGVLHAAR